MMGGAVGHVAHRLFPAGTAGAGAYALVGMGTAFAGIIRTPLTSVIMIFEVTRNYTIIVPLMISNLIAFYISQKFQHEPIYEALARQDGLHLPTGAVRQLSRQLRVSTALQAGPPPLSAGLELAEAQQRVEGRTFGSWPVVDDRGLAGMVRSSDIAAAIKQGRATATVRDLLDELDPDANDDEAVPHVHSDHPLGLALTRMGATRHTVLPVVSRANVRTLLGVVTLPDILRAYGVEHISDLPARAMVRDE
jgi:chloride channel protein, CIC family